MSQNPSMSFFLVCESTVINTRANLRVKTADLEDFGDEAMVLAQNMWKPDLWMHVLLLD